MSPLKLSNMSPLKLSEAFLRFLFLSSLLAVTRADPPFNNCSTASNFTVNSTFQHNLNLLLNSLSSNASISRFYSTVIGTGVDVVYGNFLCIGNVSLVICQNDVMSAVQDISRLCPTSKEAIVWEEYSQIRYSDRPFLGLMDDTGDQLYWNQLNISDPYSFSKIVKEMMGNLSQKAAFDSSRNMLATGESNFTAIEKVYGLVQCTRDLSGNDCNRCLRTALNNIQNCCYFYRGARVLSRSCYLRYELYPLDALGVANPPLPPPPSIPSNPPLPPPPSIPSSTKTEKINIGRIVFYSVIAAVSASFLAITLFGFCFYYSVRRKGLHKVKGNENSNQEISLHDVVAPISTTAVAPISTTFSDQNVPANDQMKAQESPLIHFDEILRATNNFSDFNILGQGGYGPVYKGVLSDGKEVAVKRLSSKSEQGSEEFMNEVLLIMKLQHKNLVRLLGFCTEIEEKILVYEYMPNSSLDIFFDPKRRVLLDWRKRLNIINGIARGLLYLHQDSRLRIIHRDLKASNVLLDQELNPKISHFGMARPFGGNLGEANTDRIVGTYGYMAPEYAMEGLYSLKSDVFSFGVLLIELVTGKRNAGFHLSKLAPSLIAYAWRLWSEGKGLELMDPILTESCAEVEFLRCVQIGLLCVQESATVRPNMSSVVVMLGSEHLAIPQPQQPAISVGRFVVHSEKSLNCSVNELTISSVSPR